MTDDLKHNDGEAVLDAATGVLGAVGLSSESGYCVERLAGGGFVVLWRDDQGAIKAQIIFSTDGSYNEEQIGEALLVSDAGSSPAVAAQADGGFVAAWLNDKTIEYRVYGHGAENASVLTIDMSDIENIDYVGDPSITVLAGGGFVVTWAMVTDSAPEGSERTQVNADGLDGAGDNSQDLYIQHFAANGDPVSEIQQIETPAYDLLPDISALPDGGYVLVWNNFSASPASTKFTNVPVQRYDADNNLVFSTVLSVPEADYYQSPDVTGLLSGGFVVAFAAKGDASGEMLHLFDNRNIEIDSFTLTGLSGRGLSGNDLVGVGDNVAPRIGANWDGGFVVTWGVGDGDGDGVSEPGDPDYISPGIYAQRFDAFGKAIDNLPQNISGSDNALGDPQFDAINDSQDGEYHDGDSQDGDSLGDTSLSGGQEVGLTRFTDYLEYDPDSTPESDTPGSDINGEHLNIVVRFNPDLIEKGGSQAITDIRILLPETVSEQAVFVEADGSPLGFAGMITLETTTGMVIWANYHTFGGNNLHIAFPKYDGEGNPYPDLTGENINLEDQIQVRLPLEGSSNFSPNFAPNFSPDFSMDIIYTTAEMNAAGEVTEYIDHDTFNVSGTASGETLDGDSDDIRGDTDTGQQQIYADVNLWTAIEKGFDPNDILKDDPLVDTGHLSKAIQQIFISLAGNRGRFLSNEEPLRNNSVVFVMALYVDQSGYLKFGPIKAAVLFDENGDLILTFEEVLVQAVTLSSAFGDFGISLELPGELPDEGLGDLNLPTETTIILYDGEALQEYFEKIQNNQEADALALREAGGTTSKIEGSFDLTVESLTGSTVVAQTGYSAENSGFLDNEDGVFFFAEDAQTNPEDQAAGTTGPLQIDVAYSVSTALVLAENATENATGDEGGDGQANEDPQSAGDNVLKAITQITIELVAIRDINYQGRPGESGERVDLAFKEGVSINAAGDQVTFYVDRDGNLREDGNLSGDGSGTREITADLIRAEDGNAITLKFVDGLSGPQMINKLELGSLIKAVLAKHSDADFDIKITVETTVYGDDNNALGTASNVDQYTISVDAVADRGTLDFTGNQDVVQLDENAHITISVDVIFDDYADGSEDHSIVLNNVPAAWVLLSDALLISGPTASAEYPGLVSYRFDVSALVDAGNGSASLPIEFDPQDWTPACGDQGGGLDNSEGHGHVGGHAEIEVQAVATEANLSGDDYLSDNNVATTTNYIMVSMDAYVPGYFVPGNLVPGENEPGENDPVHVVNLGDGNDSFDDHAPGSVIDLVNGGVGDDIIWTGDGDDILIGGSGDDRLYGEGGDDLLIGGAGDDILKGGSGADSFIFTGEDLGGRDAIRDFKVDQGDNLNLRELLDDDGSLAATGDNEALATALESYLDISSDGISTTIVVDGDGSGVGTDVATITLENVDLTVGGSFSEHDAIQALLDNQNLVID